MWPLDVDERDMMEAGITMPSPFPEMDPYLEHPALWPDFHGEFIFACRHQIKRKLPAGYSAKVDEQVRLIERSPEDDSTVARDVRPDVSVTRRSQPGVARQRGASR